MSIFTVITGSGYGEGCNAIYVVEAINAPYACQQAQAVAKAHDASNNQVLYCMAGVVAFEQTSAYPHVPTVIDLRTPDPDVLAVAVTPKEFEKLIAGLTDLGVMIIPGGSVYGYYHIITSPELARADLEQQVRDVVGRVDFTVSWTKLSRVQAERREERALDGA